MNSRTKAANVRARLADESGLSLLEIMMATALFMIVIGATAQTLTTFYGTVELQQQRAVAAQNCRTVLSWMRAVRDDADNFPEDVIAAFPHDTNLDNVPPGLIGDDDARWPLRNQTMRVEYEDPDANPLRITVRVEWDDRVGRRARLAIASALTSE